MPRTDSDTPSFKPGKMPDARASGHSVVWALKHRVSLGAVFVMASGVLIWALLPHRLADAPDLVVFNGENYYDGFEAAGGGSAGDPR